jgi:GTP-binding protein
MQLSFNLGLGIYTFASISGSGTGDLLDALIDFPIKPEPRKKSCVTTFCSCGSSNAGNQVLLML